MNQYVKKSGSDPIHFILYDTLPLEDRKRDITVVNFNPEDELYPVLELKEIIIPYSNERIGYLLEDIDNSTQELQNILERLKQSESTEDTEEIIDSLTKIGDKELYYYEELSKFRVLKNKEADFLVNKPNYFQIISYNTNKTYERGIKEHMSSLEGNIILLDSRIGSWDSRYWHLRDNAMAKLSYLQQEKHFWNQIKWSVFFVVIIDIIIRTYEQKITGYVRSSINCMGSFINYLLGKIRGLPNLIIRIFEQEIKRRVSPRLNFVKSVVSDLLGKIKGLPNLIIRIFEQEIKRRVSPRLNFVKSAINDLLGKIKTGFNKLVK